MVFSLKISIAVQLILHNWCRTREISEMWVVRAPSRK